MCKIKCVQHYRAIINDVWFLYNIRCNIRSMKKEEEDYYYSTHKE